MSYIGNTVQNQSFVPTVDYFSGNGSTTAFTLSHPVGSVYELEVVVNNVQQNPSSAYTVSGSTITFTSAPSSGSNNIYVYYTSPNTQVVQPGQGTVGTTQLADASVTAAKLASGAAIANIGAGGVAQSNLAANVVGTGPAFSAYASSGTTLNAGVWTKMVCATEEFDTNSNYDTSNSRFTPTVAGYYQFGGGCAYYSASGSERAIAFYKNGSNFRNIIDIANSGISVISGSQLIYMNGSTDYVEFYSYSSNTITAPADPAGSYFQGFLARAA